jgi:hypothetical protein
MHLTLHSLFSIFKQFPAQFSIFQENLCSVTLFLIFFLKNKVVFDNKNGNTGLKKMPECKNLVCLVNQKTLTFICSKNYISW